MIDFKKQLVDYLATREDPVKITSLLKRLGFERQYLRALLGELIKEKRVIRVGTRYWVPSGKQTSLEIKREKSKAKRQLTGKLSINRRGVGFVLNPAGNDWYIPAAGLMNAKQGDVVRAERVMQPGSRIVAEVVAIESFGCTVAVGIFESRDMSVSFIDFANLNIERHQLLGFPEDAVDGQVGQFERLAEGEWQFRGYLGHMTDPEVDESIVLAETQIEVDFPEQAIAYCKTIEEDFELGDREDFREQTVFTVDGESARDFDDALHFRPLENGQIEVGIHIADVAEFVGADSHLDRQAKERANSVYLPHKAIPMLPERLSSELCSLKPGQPRYTLSMICNLDKKGNLKTFKLAKGLIESRYRLTYKEVEAIGIDRDEQVRARYAGVAESIDMGIALSRKMRARRNKAGGLQIDMSEVRAVLGEDHLLKEIHLERQTDANRMIEAFMILANESAAHYLEERGIGVTFRIHEEPDPDRLDALASFWVSRGYKLPETYTQHTGQSLNKMIKSLHDSAAGEVLQLQILKSLKLAEYSTKNRGHFGLASTHYAHFTSPIRRYADLRMHQRIGKMLGMENPRPEQFDDRELASICQHISAKERMATRAHQSFLLLKQLRRMEAEVGNTFEGVITDVKTFGFFVSLKPWQVSGLVHIDTLTDDYYHYDEQAIALKGKRKGYSWGVGDLVEVRVERVDLITRRLDLSPEVTSKPMAPNRRRIVKPQARKIKRKRSRRR